MVDGRRVAMFELNRESADVQQPQRRVATGRGQRTAAFGHELLGHPLGQERGLARIML